MKEHKSSLQSFVNSLTPMEESEFLKIWELCEFKKIEKSSFFVQAGSQENKLGFVLSGLFKVYYTDSEGGERIRNFVGPGHPVAPYSDLI